MSLVKLSHELSLPPVVASLAKYGKVLIMKKSTAETSEEISPACCQLYAISEIEIGMSSPAAEKSDLSELTYLARFEGEPKSLS